MKGKKTFELSEDSCYTAIKSNYHKEFKIPYERKDLISEGKGSTQSDPGKNNYDDKINSALGQTDTDNLSGSRNKEVNKK